jgi:cell filamentation protein
MVGGYGAFDDPYVYPGTSVLRNLLDIRDAKVVESYEGTSTGLKLETGTTFQ